eukprot:scaffold11809_cov128-Cylindrotheca_fusiformis.AAC.21
MKSTRISEVFFLPFIFTLPKYCVGYVYHLPFSPNKGYTSKQTTTLKVSELHVPGYTQSKIPFILKDEHLQEANPDGTLTLRKLEEMRFGVDDFQSVIPHDGGHLVHKTKKAIFTQEECQQIVDEAEAVASRIEWTKNRHGNFPTTDLPLTELPETMKFLRVALVERLYPMLREQFGTYLPDPSKLRLADGFVVKYDALGGQKELKPHRDGSVVSFNIALNPASDFEGGGTWFASLDDAVKIDQGQVVSHSSALLHGGHGITAGKRYIMVGFVILEGYDSWSMRFYNQVRNM